MKQLYPYLLFLAFLYSCSPDSEAEKVEEMDTIAPVISLNGLKIDTAYLNAIYHDKGVGVLDEVHGEVRCPDYGTEVETKGYIDTRIKGIYTLSYTAHDRAGNLSPTLTRTVHVVENNVNFLCGDYSVTYTCTANVRGAEGSTVTTGNYKATVTAGEINNRFDLASLNTGPMFKVLNGELEGNKLNVDYWDADFSKTDAKGYISNDKNSFTIEATTFMYTYMYYKTINVYTKQVVIKTLSQK